MESAGLELDPVLEWEQELLAESEDDQDDDKAAQVGYTQFAQLQDGSGYSPVGKTVGELSPGYYDTIVADGTLYFMPVRARDDALLEFPDSVSKEVLAGITEFWNREKLFRKYEIPYKRGVLLYGPPGSGKTCTLQLVAREVVKRNGVVLTFAGSQVFLRAYRALRDIQPDTHIVVLMEDFESVIKNYESQVLNMLDGVESLDRIVFLATTNYPEKLESRIINRPSRFDICVKVDHPDERARRVYLESLVHDDDDIDISAYVSDTSEMSLAHVKELFVATVVLGCDYSATVKRLEIMRDERKSSNEDEVKRRGGMGMFL